MTPAWIARLPGILVAILTVGVAAMYVGIFRGEVAGDDNTFHFAEVARIAEAVNQGDWDWWNPSANAGFATGYYYQLIPTAVPGILAAIFGNPLRWFQLGIFLPLVLLPVAGYRALRVFELDRWAALGGAIALAFSIGGSKWGQDGVLLVGLYSQGWALCMYPLAFAYGCQWMATGRGFGAAVGWGLMVGACHPVAGVALGPSLLLVSFALGMWTRPWWTPQLRLAGLGGLLLIGSAAVWMPVLIDYDGFGGFPHRLSDEAGPGFKLLARWLRSGYLLDYERVLADRELPILTVLLAPSLLYAMALTFFRSTNSLLLLWISVVALAFILGVGRVLKTQDDIFPAVRVMGALQVTLALAIGAAVGDGITRAIRELDRVDLGEVAQAVVAMIGGLAVIAFVGPAASVLSSRARVATDYDLIYRDEFDLLLPAIRSAAPGRIQTRGVDNHWFMMLPYIYGGKPALVAYGGAALQSSPNFVYLHTLPPVNRAAWIYDAPLVLTRRGNTAIGGRVLTTTEHFELRELPSPGRIGPVQIVGTLPPGRQAARAASLRWQASDSPLANQVLAHHGHGTAVPPGNGAAHHIVDRGSRITARLEVSTPTTFAIRDSWHPRWQATIDGRSVPIRRITPDMMAIDALPGSHRLLLRFDRPWWTWWLYWLIPATIAIAWRLGSRTQRSGT